MGVRDMLGRLARLYETDRRKLIRVPASFSAALSAGILQCDAQGIDLHRAGMKVRCDMAFDVGAKVFVRLHGHRLVAFALVRHCAAQADGNYIVGMQFTEPLTKERGTGFEGSNF